MENVRTTLDKLAKLQEALEKLVHDDREYGEENITDFSYCPDSFASQGQPMVSFVDYIKANSDVAYNLAVTTGDKVRAKYPHSMIPKGNNEIYTNSADDSTPPMTHAELLARVKDCRKALV